MSKVIIITGTSKGIGQHLCEYYLKSGATVIGCSRNNSGIINEYYHHYKLDVSDEKAVIKMVREIIVKFQKIDVLVNNAGIASMNHFTLTPLITVKKIFDTNFLGTFIFTREVAKTMTKHKKGRIINFSTCATPLRLEGEAIYAASKAAIVNLTEVTAKELAPYGITVNAVGPTPVQTDLIKGVPIEKINALLARQAVKRYGTYDDIANVIDFFIDDKSDFITGQVIYLGGING
jgi:3-oxoacyl-[acyl-carrier protein] reductase